MRIEKRRGRVVSKYTTRGVQPLNGKNMLLDFPFKRPVYYHLEMENGDTVEVSASEYSSYRVGDTISYDNPVLEMADYLFIAFVSLLGIFFFVFLLIIAA